VYGVKEMATAGQKLGPRDSNLLRCYWLQELIILLLDLLRYFVHPWLRNTAVGLLRHYTYCYITATYCGIIPTATLQQPMVLSLPTATLQ